MYCPKRIIGFEIGKSFIYASQIYLSGNVVRLEKFFTESLDLDSTVPYQDRVQAAIKKIMQHVQSYDQVRTSINSSMIIFKELTLPFLDPDKISLVLRHELESVLPFSINDALIDFIVTKQLPDAKGSAIMTAAVQKNYVAQHLTYFENTGIRQKS